MLDCIRIQSIRSKGRHLKYRIRRHKPHNLHKCSLYFVDRSVKLQVRSSPSGASTNSPEEIFPACLSNWTGGDNNLILLLSTYPSQHSRNVLMPSMTAASVFESFQNESRSLSIFLPCFQRAVVPFPFRKLKNSVV